jgi:hypothetical protein
MSATTGYYWLVQYCADLARLEAVNVGVVLFVPEREFLRAAVSRSNRRVERFFKSGEVDTVHLDGLKESVANGLELSAARLGTVEDVDAFLRLRADEILVTPARTVRVEDPAATLARLLDDLVEDEEAQAAVAGARAPEAFAIVRDEQGTKCG